MTNGRHDKKVIEKKPEPERITLSERHAAHKERHPNDLGRHPDSPTTPGGVQWINLNKKGNENARARHEALDRFYETHEWIGEYPNTMWVKIETPEEEEE
jgi:hypothetical protein